MKKLIIPVGLIFLLGAKAYAQPANVVNAYNYLKYYDKDKSLENIKNAKENIDLAAKNSETADKAKTWNYRAKVYLSIMQSKNPEVKALAPNAIKESYLSSLKAIQIEQPLKPSKREWSLEATDWMNSIYLPSFVNAGAEAYTAKDYVASLDYFESAIEVSNFIDTAIVAKSKDITDQQKKALTDTKFTAVNNAALAAEKGKNIEKASKYYQMLIDAKQGGAETFYFYATMLRNSGDEEGAIKIIRDGRKDYPNDKGLVLDELNYYLKKGQSEEAINNLKIAINNDPTNPLLHYSIGTLYDNLANPTEEAKKPAADKYKTLIDDARKAYEKAIELKADYFDAQYNLGALYFNQAVIVNNEANNLPPKESVKYDKLKAESKDLFTKAAPYLEKAHELDPKDKATMQSLKQLYAQTGNSAKYKEMNTKLAN